MSVYSRNTKLNHIFSKCSISDFKHRLFYSSSKSLKQKFTCLNEKNFHEDVTIVNNIKQLMEGSLQGQHYSFFEQCIMYTANKEAIALRGSGPCELWCDSAKG